MDKILQAFKDIAEAIPTVDKLKAVFGESMDFQRVLALIYSDILEFIQRVYKFFRRRTWHLRFAIDWGLFERRFKSILAKLASHCDLLDKEATAIHFSEMKRMRDARQLDDEDFEQRRRQRMVHEVFRWLSAAEDSQEEHLHQLADKRQPGTCNWILENDHILSWTEDEIGNGLIWMTGIPGAGKSFLCSLLVENLELRQDQTSLYYFCGLKSSLPDSCSSVLRTLTVQVVRQNLDFAPHIHQAYLQKGSGHSSSAMKRMLKELFSFLCSTRIVLDGVDECDHSVQKELLTSLLELQKHAGEKCKILVSSRNEIHINKAMPCKTHIALDGKTNESLCLYIERNVEDLKLRFPNMELSLFQRVEQRLREKAKGMFLWVRLVATMLLHQSSEMDFENAIEQLPDGLEEAYGLILNRIDKLSPVLKDRAFKVLFWVCAAYRPVTIHDVADGLALRPGQTILSKKTRSQDMNRDILELCAPIIEKSSSGVLDLVHFSAKEYLVHPQSGPFVDVAQAHFSIGFSCIANLTSALTILPRFSDGTTELDHEKRIVQGGYGLQDYSHRFWAAHVKAYLENIPVLGSQAMILVEALKAFSHVKKNRSTTSVAPVPEKSSQRIASGFQELASFPELLSLVNHCLHFRSQLDEMAPSFESLNAQEQWQLQKDETFLSLIDCRLREVTERLLSTDSSKLPAHIGKDDFAMFVDRFGFLCRFHTCNYHSGSIDDRNVHEETHIVSFLCLECDFSRRGFRSRKDLEKHTKRYHMSMEDFEIPASLYSGDISSWGNNVFTSGKSLGAARTSRCWNEQGRKVLQGSFRQVLARLQSEVAAANNEGSWQNVMRSEGKEEADFSAETSLRQERSSTKLKEMQDKIEEQGYHSLAEFKDDVRRLSIYSHMDGTLDMDGFETICDRELEKTLAGYSIFANYDSKSSPTSRYSMNGGISEDNHDYLHNDNEANEGNATCLSASGSAWRSKRTLYWSEIEKEEFPKLVELYGRDFRRISDFLKTKTADEVEQYFLLLLRTGRENLSSLADAAEIKAQLRAQPDQSPPELQGTPADMPIAETGPDNTIGSCARYLGQPFDTSFSYGLPPESLLGMNQQHSTVSRETLDADTSIPALDINVRPRKRRAPPRAFCPYCTDFPDGLLNEYTLKKHIIRFHKISRKVWVCVDASVDKRFLARCKACSSSKRYHNKGSAAKHLQQAHFPAKPSVETLLRWMKEIEIPNQSYMKTESAASSNKGPDQLPSLWQAMKHLENNSVRNSKGSAYRLPGIRSMSSPRSNSSRSPTPPSTSSSTRALNDYEDASKTAPDPSVPDDSMLFPDISFDNILPGSRNAIPRINDPGTQRADRALIRPDQVPRLPHLNPHQKAACQDQVDALHETLNREPKDGESYQKALEDLTSLSRTLRKQLADWQQSSAMAPNIPVSI